MTAAIPAAPLAAPPNGEDAPPPLPPKDVGAGIGLDAAPLQQQAPPQSTPTRSSGRGSGTRASLVPSPRAPSPSPCELAVPTSAATTDTHAFSPGSPNLGSRLSALFHASPVSTTAPTLPPVSTAGGESPIPVVPGMDALASQINDRNAIKVLVVTWNMGDALPKGDLSVLLGDVPPYVANQYEADETGLPKLPVANVHPYHVIVFAAQECPTPSGVPRGLGAGLSKGKGVGLQAKEQPVKKLSDGKEVGLGLGLHHNKDGGKEKEKDKEKEKEVLLDDTAATATTPAPKPLRMPSDDKVEVLKPPEKRDSSKGGVLLKKEGLKESLKNSIDTLGLIDRSESNGSPAPALSDRKKLERLRETYESGSSSPIRITSPMATAEASFSGSDASKGQGPKGWSAMLEEWLCAGPPRPPSPESTSPMSLENGPTASPSSPRKGHKHTPSKPIHIPMSSPKGHHLVPLHHSHLVNSVTASEFEPGSTNSVFGTSVATTATTGTTAPLGTTPAASVAAAPPASALGSSIPSSGFLEPPPEPSRPSLTRSLSQQSIGSGRSMGDRTIDGWNWDNKPRREPGAGPYVNVAKDRLLGLYLSVFVHKGCEHLVHGFDKDYVTTGLAGGRFGNKGGIGISLHLGSHRLLFINAHLAAHAGRNDARIANINKIKSELKLNCFLPDDDPRAQLPDLTDRFDTSFWCGDLNFRVDITRQHADWLLKQNKYPEAMAWDQLHKAMEDPTTNPLPGFEEAPITFMPTFKYDVWKSVRATNRDMRRSFRRERRKTIEKGGEGRSSCEVQPSSALHFVPEGDMPEESVSEGEGDPQACAPPACNDPDNESVRSSVCYDEGPNSPSHSPKSAARSLRSATTSASTPVSPSTPGSITGSTVANTVLNSGTSRPRPTLKEKGRKLMNILRLGNGRPLARASPPQQPANGDRRTSMTSFRSFVLSEDGVSTVISDDPTPSVHHVEDPTSNGLPHVHLLPVEVNGHMHQDVLPDNASNFSGQTAHSHGHGHGHARRPSSSSILHISPPRRHISLRRRSTSVKAGPDSVIEDDDFDDTVDNRVGVYDSSKKQRIPSWCDRVLWKTHVIPDEEAFDEDDEDDDSSMGSRGDTTNALRRLTHVFTNFGNFGATLRHRSVTWDSTEQRDLPLAPGTPPTAPTHGAGSVLISPDSVPSTPVAGAHATFASESPERLAVSTGDSPQISPIATIASSSFPNPSRNRSVTFDGPSAAVNPSTDASISPHIRPRVTTNTSVATTASTSTDSHGRSPISARARRASSPHAVRRASKDKSSENARRGSVSSRRSSLARRRSGDLGPIGPPPAGSMIGGTGKLAFGPPMPAPMAPLFPVRTTGHSMDDAGSHGRDAPHSHSRDGSGYSAFPCERRLSSRAAEKGMAMIPKFLRNLPGRLASRVSLFHGQEEHGDEGEGHLAARARRHMVGEVQVLHYGTIDDAGMRLLEGRSDHRPAIFAAAVYV